MTLRPFSDHARGLVRVRGRPQWCLGRAYTQYGTLPGEVTSDRPDEDPTGPTDACGQAAVPPGHSSNKPSLVPPAGFEPALPPPEAGRTLIIPVSGVLSFSFALLCISWVALVSGGSLHEPLHE